MKKLTLEFYLSDSEYMTALRLVAGAVCSSADCSVDVLEDFKVCVTESIIILKNCGFDSVCVAFGGEKDVCCTVSGEGGLPCAGENELSLALISALVKECALSRRGEIIERVTLKI